MSNHQQTDSRNVRIAAEAIYQNVNSMYRQYPSIDFSRSQHSINFISEDFLAGYMQDGRMSVVRRFFCLFVTFDFLFISLLWLICIVIKDKNIYKALDEQVVHYTIYTSLFDIVMAAACRFTFLVLFYALIYMNHWLIVALSTSGSCAFLIAKVFAYDWEQTSQPVFEVLIIVVSFVLSWGEAWFLDCRVIPQERHAKNYITAFSPTQNDDVAPLIPPFIGSESNRQPADADFYSPYDSAHNSEDEDAQDDEYINMGKECVRKANELLRTSEWKIEKVTASNDTIQSTQHAKLKKIYRLTAQLQIPAKMLLENLFYKIEEIPRWNPTILESKIIKKVDTHTDISYQATASSGGGLVKSRDFVNLRCWHLCRDGIIVDLDETDDISMPSTSIQAANRQSTINWKTNTNHDVTTDDECILQQRSMKKSTSELMLVNESKQKMAAPTLSKSLGAQAFHDDEVQSGDDDRFEDAESETPHITLPKQSQNMYVSAAVSLVYAGAPIEPKYIRGENLLSCWAMQEIDGNPDSCIFEWLLCLDLKGFVPRYVLETAYTTFMQDYMVYLRKYCNELKRRRIKNPTESR